MHTSQCPGFHPAVSTVVAPRDVPRRGSAAGDTSAVLLAGVVRAGQRFGVVVAGAAPFLLLAFRRPPTAADVDTVWQDPAEDDDAARPDVIPFGATGPVRVVFPAERWCIAIGDLEQSGGHWRRPMIWADDLAAFDTSRGGE